MLQACIFSACLYVYFVSCCSYIAKRKNSMQKWQVIKNGFCQLINGNYVKCDRSLKGFVIEF